MDNATYRSSATFRDGAARFRAFASTRRVVPWLRSAFVPGTTVAFWGVRGSTPCDGPEYARYGGNTSCVEVTADGHAPVIFDLGTGLRGYGQRLLAEGAANGYAATALLTHLHWDHVQGLPFFAPLSVGGGALQVYGPRDPSASFGALFDGLMRPPYFPVRAEQLAGRVDFHDVEGGDDFAVGGVEISARWVRHTGPTLAFRVAIDGVSIAYVPDHGPGCSSDHGDDFIPDDVLALCDGVDLLIHDAQHTADEFAVKRSWGHCPVDYALHVAREAGVRTLALFHHCPSHDDAAVDRILRDAQDTSARRGGPEVFAASDGLRVELSRPVASDAGR